jgi:hypothetical protein
LEVYIVILCITTRLKLSSPEKNKTLIRSIRITKELDNLLQKDANAKRISVNALILMIMSRYAEMDRYNERFDTITLRRKSLKSILDEVEDENVIKVAKQMGTQIPKESLLFWFKRANLETYLQYLSLLCRYAGFAEYEIEIEGNEYTITLIHDMGEKWSIFLKNVIEQELKTTSGIMSKSDISANSVLVRFHPS